MTRDDLEKTAKDIGDSVSGAVETSRDTISDRGEKVAAQAPDLAGDVVNAAKDALGRAASGAADLGDRVPHSAGDALDAGRDAMSRGSEHVLRQVARQPIEALLLAGAVGYLVGWAANRR